jgi:tetratricopeptide (TPR) repeat protein
VSQRTDTTIVENRLAVPAPGSLPDNVFVGRDREMSMLQAAVDETLRRCGRLILIGGEPGIGKTRTAETVTVHARDRGALILWGRCYAAQGAPAFWPWVAVLRSAIRALDEGMLLQVLGGDAAVLSPLLAQVTQCTAAPPTPAAESPEARFRLFDGVARFLERLGERMPSVIVLDDLHEADRASLFLLDLIAQRLRELPILVIGTYRDGEGAGDGALDATIAGLLRAPRAIGMRLQALNESEVEQMVQARAGEAVPPALAAQIYQRSEGNPLFVRELIELLMAEGRMTAEVVARWQATVPKTVRAAIVQRLRPLSSACWETLRIAALLGREFDLALLSDVLSDATDVSLRETKRIGVSGAVDAARDAGILVPMVHGRQRYRFAHALIREVLLDGLGAERSVALHAIIGAALERRPDRAPYLRELAYHFSHASGAARSDGTNESALVPGVHEKAVAYSCQAADRAAQMLAYEEAVRWYQQALELLERVSGADERARCDVLIALGIAQRDAGSLEDSKATLLRAAQLTRQLDQPEQLARAALHFGTKVVWGEPSIPDPTLVGLLEAAASALGNSETRSHARVLARLALALRFSFDTERCLYVSRRALEMARRLADPTVIIEALHAWLTTNWRPDNGEQRRALSAELVARAEQAQDQGSLILAYGWRCKLLAEHGDWPGVRAAQHRCEQLALRSREPLYQWWIRAGQAARAIHEGRFAQAASLIQDACALEQTLNQGVPLGHLSQLISLWSLQGRTELLGAILDSQGTSGGAFPGFVQQCSAANIACELGRVAAASTALEGLAGRRFADFPQDESWLTCMHYMAEVCAFVGDGVRAEIVLEQLRPYENCAVINPASGVFLAPVAHDLALLETCLRLWLDAVRHFDQALRMSRMAAARPATARTQCEYARMLLTRGWPGDAPQADRLLDAALETARDLEMGLLEQRVLALKDRMPSQADDQKGSSPTSSQAAATGPPHATHNGEAVFQREGEYWTLGEPHHIVRLKDSRGLQYLWYLVAHPGQEFLALDLVVRTRKEADASFTATPVRDAALTILDASSKVAYRQRLAELRSSVEEAEAADDRGMAERARAEIEFIEDELAAAIGLGGRDRTSGSSAERARSTVSKGIKRAVARISAVHPTLGRHLDRTVRTGVFCAYLPAENERLSWQL